MSGKLLVFPNLIRFCPCYHTKKRIVFHTIEYSPVLISLPICILILLNLTIMWLMSETEQRLESLCSRIIESDKAIRFVGISNKMGNQIISRYRSGLTSLLTPTEIEMYAMRSVLRMNTRKDYESKLGKPIYSFYNI